jgi:hypothetical protein
MGGASTGGGGVGEGEISSMSGGTRRAWGRQDSSREHGRAARRRPERVGDGTRAAQAGSVPRAGDSGE